MDYNITYRQKDKGWQVIISYKNENGHWKQKSKQGFKTKKDAKPIADKMIEEIKSNTTLSIASTSEFEGITFKEFTDMFMEHLKLHIEANTLKAYQITIRRFLALHELNMKNITSLDIQNCVDELVKDGLKLSTIKTYISKIKTLFNYAINNYNIIAVSPVKNIRIKGDKTQNIKKALSENELTDLLFKLKNDNRKYYICALIASKCGLRIGEIAGLLWSDIDFENNIIVVNKQFKRLENDKFGFGSLKSKNSNRKVPCSDFVIKELKEFRHNISVLNIDNRIISNKCIATLSTKLAEKFRKLGYDISVHELRHTYATVLIGNGIDYKTIASLLGHDVTQTMHTYTHVSEDMLSNARSIINKVM
ncbi:MAG: site-specific integrase [Clostridium sp.]